MEEPFSPRVQQIVSIVSAALILAVGVLAWYGLHHPFPGSLLYNEQQEVPEINIELPSGLTPVPPAPRGPSPLEA